MAMLMEARGGNISYYRTMQALQERQRRRAEESEGQVTPFPTRIKIERPTGTVEAGNNSDSQTQVATVSQPETSGTPEATS
ncbi:MAG: hypothetical protein M1444_04500 [Patescibacteria group bacterium]|nr:hypothetical protein [Patescibacteria group bacterium]